MPKKHKAGKAQSRKYLLKLKLECRETSEGVIHYQATDDTIKFKDGNFISFVGEADLPYFGQAVSFFARKVFDVPRSSGGNWADCSERN